MNDTALKNLLFRLADDELITGHRNSEWTGVAPILEEDIALSSIAQDEIGHAQAYYTLLADLGAGEPDAFAFLRDASRFVNAQLCELPTGDWAFAVARQYLYDAAESVRLAALSRSNYAPLAQLARKLSGEEKYHLLHGKTWINHLGRGTDESRARLQAALESAFSYALGLFETPADEAELTAANIQLPEAELRRQWLTVVAPVLDGAGLTVPATRAVEGGRCGEHTEHLAKLLDDMQLVFRSDPEAEW
ncbi:MAG: phenylacetate-CoA oxygenase subunit PaaC [Chloroflexi bacterium]|nr:phenylacetate-CoA oxygenase subunit PaaC [Chloroflexota bacterium]MBI4316304.1 phenylacetate-CoA oxygenase subunit PaaC [Chloroflexota bacterium]